MPPARNISQSAPPAESRRPPGWRRLLAIKIAFFCGFVIVAARLVHVQLVEGPHYQELARRQYQVTVPLPAMRGVIYDRNGNVVASNTMAVSYGADRVMVGTRAPALAAWCARTFGKPARTYLQLLRARERGFTWLERRAPAATRNRPRPADMPGLAVFDEPRRLYHKDNLAGQVIGFTDVDNNGLSGIELQCENWLRGTDGFVVMQRDGGRKPGLHPAVDYPRQDPVNGNNVVLTLDLACQEIAEQQLREGVERTGATSGLVVMLDPRTGEVLAMANYPGLNPDRASAVPEAARKNRIITDRFEPGSVFKIVTAAAALEHHIVKPDEQIYAERGLYHVKGRLKPITDTHEYGMLTFRQGVELSSNIVMAKVSDRIGAEIFFTTARDFGFGIPTGVGLPGEVSGDLKKPTEWSGSTLNSMAFGYEVGVTAMQVIAAYAAVANGGVLMRPWIIRQVVDPDGEVLFEGSPQVIRRVIAKETAALMTSIFEGVVQRGTGTSAQIEGFSVAGKTGTARQLVDGEYQRNYNASFVGFFPADDPRVVCLVVLDNPKAGGYTGGQVSAPIFRGIAARVRTISDRFAAAPPVVSDGRRLTAVPDVTNLEAGIAAGILEEEGFDVEGGKEGTVVLDQAPAPGTRVRRGSTVRLSVDRAGARDGSAAVPDVRGLAVRRAVNRLTAAGLDATVTGSGLVTAQSPAAGQAVPAGTCILLRCSPGMTVVAARENR